ncbi:3'(2'),5'-bisphosphate nucleotidase CysQ [Bacteroidota bacterium]
MRAANIRISDLISIAKEAGDKILEVYHSKSEYWEVSVKSDASPLTLADKLSNEVINRRLLEKFPEIPIISEENKEIPFEDRKHYDLFWLVDPLDGTKEFIKRNGEFTVNIALIEHQQAVGGIVYVPCQEKMYYAQQGKGAFIIENGITFPLHAHEYSLAQEKLVIVASRSHMNDETIQYISQFKHAETTSIGSSLKLLLVAEGKAHIYPRLGPTMEWDTAAAHAIVQEAGGSVVRYEDNNPLIYNKENLLNPYFIVFGKVV